MFDKKNSVMAEKEWTKAQKISQKENKKNPNADLQRFACGFEHFAEYMKRKNDTKKFDEALNILEKMALITQQKIQKYNSTVSTYEKKYETIFEQTKTVFEALELFFYCRSILKNLSIVNEDEISSIENLPQFVRVVENQAQWFSNLGEWKNAYDIYSLLYNMSPYNETIRNKYISIKANCAYELGKEYFNKNLHFFSSKFFTIAYTLQYPCKKELIDSLQYLIFDSMKTYYSEAELAATTKQKVDNIYNVCCCNNDLKLFQQYIAKTKLSSELENARQTIIDNIDLLKPPKNITKESNIIKVYEKWITCTPFIEIYAVILNVMDADLANPLLTPQVLNFIEKKSDYFCKRFAKQYESYLIAKKFILDSVGPKFDPSALFEIIDVIRKKGFPIYNQQTTKPETYKEK